MAIGLTSSLFLNLPKAHAADAVTNVELAKKVIKEVAPIVSDSTSDVDRAALALGAKDYIEKPLVVETKITAEPAKVKASKSKDKVTGGVHYFPYGYCTYYVSQKREITWSGNAGTWLKGAKSADLKTGDEPKAGSIMVTSEGGSAGHVAYVEKIDGDLVTISEMNFSGFGIVSSRTISADSRFIKGYIY